MEIGIDTYKFHNLDFMMSIKDLGWPKIIHHEWRTHYGEGYAHYAFKEQIKSYFSIFIMMKNLILERVSVQILAPFWRKSL